MSEPAGTPQGTSESFQILPFLRRRWWLIAACGLAAVVAGFVLSYAEGTKYEARAFVLLDKPLEQRLAQSGKESSEVIDTGTSLELLELDSVAAATAERVGGGYATASVADAVSVAQQGTSNLFEVEAVAESPQLAADLANTYGEVFIARRRQADRLRIHTARLQVEEALDDFSSGMANSADARATQRLASELEALESLQTGNAVLEQPASPPTEKSSPKPLRNGVFGGILGLLVGAAFALVLDRADRRFRSAADLGSGFALPLLGTIPSSPAFGRYPRGTLADLPAEAREAFRLLRSRLRYFNVGREVRAILVTSASAGEGKSTVARYLASAAAEAGERAILIDADFRDSSTADGASRPGLSEVLSGQAKLDDVIEEDAGAPVGDDGRRAMHVIHSGGAPPNPAELLESDGVAAIVSSLRDRFDLIVVDAPAITRFSDGIPLVRMVDGVVVVGRVGRTTPSQAASLEETLDRLDVLGLGVVANASGRNS